jgi:uncharacterized membrane protein YqjE
MNLLQFGWRAVTDNRPFIKDVVSGVAGMSRLHVALFIAEAKLEKARLQRKALLSILGGVLLLMALLFFVIAIMVSAWDTPYRLHVLYGVPLLFAIGGGIALTMAANKKNAAPPFQRTSAELKKDADWLMGLL